MNMLSTNVSFNILDASHILPNSDAISNLEILQNFPRTSTLPLAVQHKMAAMLYNEHGFQTRYWTHKPWLSLDLSIENSESLATIALAAIVEKDRDIDVFILGSTTNSRYSGSQASAVLGKFAIQAPAYDFKAGCSTSLANLHMAYSMMALGYKKVLVCCAETMSKVIDPDNEKTWLSLADGAAALLLEQNSKGKFTVEKTFYSTDGRYVNAFTTKGILPPTEKILSEQGYYLKGDDQQLKDLAICKYTEMLDQLFQSECHQQISHIIAHQVNRKLIETVIEKYHLSHCQLIWDATEIGNIGGASILYSLAKAHQKNLFQDSGKILMMSVGGGLSYACQLISFKQDQDE